MKLSFVTHSDFLKKILLSFILFYFPVVYTLAQLPEIDVSTSDLVTIPNSPEVSSFIEYGKNTVSMYTGKPDISIPIHTIQGRKLSSQISLSYSPGIQVDQIATDVGLGWNLNIGGAITRNTVGLPDTYDVGMHDVFYAEIYGWGGSGKLKDKFEYFRNNNISPNVSFDEQVVDDYLDFRRRVIDRLIETQPDSYSFYVNGLSGTLYLDYSTGEGFCLEHPDLKVEANFGSTHTNGVKQIDSWKLTDKLGNTYVFAETEITKSFEDDGVQINNMEYNSAWKVTQICSFDNSDCLSFGYTPKIQYTNTQPVQGATMRRDGPTDNGSTWDCPVGFTAINGSAQYRIQKGFLQTVSVNSNAVASIIYEQNERTDLEGTYAIDKIQIKNIQGALLKVFDLQQSYFQINSPVNEFDYRLKLDAVSVYNSVPNNPQQYTFDYFGPNLPERGSFAQDYWGYYNGNTGNQSLIPHNPDYSIFTQGGDRSVSEAHIKAGTLKSIQYPTGGSTEYSYEVPYIEENEYVDVLTNFGVWSLTGGTDPTNAIGHCDDTPIGHPKGITGKLIINRDDEGDFQIDVNVTGSSSNPYQYVAFFVENYQDSTHCDVYEDQSLLFYRHSIQDETVTEILSGTYRYMIVNDDPNTTISIAVRKIVPTLITKRINIGSLRLNHWANLDEDGTIVSRKYYKYTDVSSFASTDFTETKLSSNNHTSAILHQPLMFEILSTAEQHDDLAPDYWDCQFLNRYATNQATRTPHIVTYNVVSEIAYDVINNTYNGFSVNYFHNKSEALGTSPYRPTELLNGMIEKKEVYGLNQTTEQHFLVQKEEKSYETEWLTSGQWAGVDFVGNLDQDFIDLEVWIDPNDNTKRYYRFMPTPRLGEQNIVMPSPCGTVLTDLNFEECLFPGGTLGDPCTCPTDSYTQINTGGSSYWIKDISTASYRYSSENPSEYLTTTSNNYYASNVHYQLTKTEITDSHGKLVSVENSYPHDISDQSTAMSGLIADHRVGEVVETSRFYEGNSTPQIKKRVVFDQKNGEYLPVESQLYSQGNLAKSIQIISYDSYNNAREIIDEKGVRHTFIYGYQGHQLVAHIQGSGFTEVLSALGGAITFDYDGNQAFSITKHNQLLNNLPTTSVVNSYVYDPGIGITEQRDTNGLTNKFEYDDLGRLTVVKDNNENIISVNEYHYYNEN